MRSTALCLTIGFYQNSTSLCGTTKTCSSQFGITKIFQFEKNELPKFFKFTWNYQNAFNSPMLNHSVLPKFDKLSAELQKLTKSIKRCSYKRKVSMDIRFRHPFTCIVAGPTQTGKTHWVKKFVDHCDSLMSQPPQPDLLRLLGMAAHLQTATPKSSNDGGPTRSVPAKIYSRSP